jgi:hypothetical protein
MELQMNDGGQAPKLRGPLDRVAHACGRPRSETVFKHLMIVLMDYGARALWISAGHQDLRSAWAAVKSEPFQVVSDLSVARREQSLRRVSLFQ